MKSRNVIKSLAMINQIGISMMVPIFLCGALGRWLGRLFNSDIIFLVLIVIGLGAALRNLYIVTKSFYARDMKKEHERLDYVSDLKEYKKNHPKEDIIIEKKKKRYKDPTGPTRN